MPTEVRCVLGPFPAEDYSVERVEKLFCGPALRTRREHAVYDAIKVTGSRHWLERAPEGGIHCASGHACPAGSTATSSATRTAS